MTQRPLTRRTLPLKITLLLALLTVVLVSVGGMLAFSNLTLQREFRKLPTEIQVYLRARDEARRKGEPLPRPPAPPSQRKPQAAQETRAGTPAETQTGASGQSRTRPPWPLRQVDWLRALQWRLLQIGLIAVALSTLLAFWLAWRISAPLTVVSQAAQRLAGGETGVRVPVFRTERELAGLASSFNSMAGSLEKLEAERRQAVSDIAHELRTPLAVMQARLDALEDGIYPMNVEQLSLLSAQTQLLTRLVGDLRTLTLLDAGQLALRRQETDLTHLAGEVVDSFQVKALERGISLELRPGQTCSLTADPDRLRQILTNLLENALRHAEAQVVVGLDTVGEQVYLTVDDDGAGIPAEKRQEVFTRFTRLDASRSRDAGGSGLGLAIVQALAQAHGGTASAQASELGGSRMVVTLPLGQLSG